MTAAAIELGPLFRLLWHRRWPVLAAAVLGAVAAVLIVGTEPIRYTAAGLLIPSVPASAPDDNGARDLATDQDLLRSRAVLAEVVDRLDLGANATLAPRARVPDLLRAAGGVLTKAAALVRPHPVATAADARAIASADALDVLERRVRIDNRENSRALSVSVNTGSPDLSAAIANAIMSVYVERDLRFRRADALRSVDWLRAQAAAAKTAVDAAETRLRTFRDTRNVLTLEAGATATLQLSTEQTDLANAERELAQARLVLDIDKRAAAGGDDGQAAADMLSSPVIQSLRGREIDVTERVSELDALGPRNPRHLALEDELRQVRGQLSREIGKIEQSDGQAVTLAQQRVDTLKRLLVTSQTQAASSGDAQLVMARLTSDLEARQALERDLLHRIADTELAANQLVPARVASAAVPPIRPEPSGLPTFMLLGAFGAGGLVGAALVLRQISRGVVRSADELVALTGHPNVGSLPKLGRKGRRDVVDFLGTYDGSAITETIRGIRLAVQQLNRGASTSVMVTSACAGEGKSTLAAAIAVRAAMDGLRVLLVEADLHRPSLQGLLDLEPTAGPEQSLQWMKGFDCAFQIESRSGAGCIVARSPHQNPSRVLCDGRFADLVAKSRGGYDLIVVDTPPLLSVSDPLLIASDVDTVLFAVAADETPGRSVLEALRRLPEPVQDRIVTLLNRAAVSPREPAGYYAGYGPKAASAERALTIAEQQRPADARLKSVLTPP